ncbi:hypothetical protein J4E81_003453 [Alternaria sp. BMP 2799]|nr:hypothetical protein J4E81_003453 [Alternaria sp. BMP 2799]
MQSDAKKIIAQQTHRADEIFKRNATTSPLLLLPAELRNMIYVLAMSHGDIIMDFNDAVYGTKAADRNRWPDHQAEPQAEPLLFVCRQIYAEVALLPYKLNRFKISGNLCYDLYFMLDRRTEKQIALMEEVWWMYADDGEEWCRTGLEWLRFLCKYDYDEELRMRMGDDSSEDSSEDEDDD